MAVSDGAIEKETGENRNVSITLTTI